MTSKGERPARPAAHGTDEPSGTGPDDGPDELSGERPADGPDGLDESDESDGLEEPDGVDGLDEPSGAYRTTAHGRYADARRRRRVGPRRVVGWLTVVGVVAAGGWIITRPHPGDWIPGLGPSSQDAAKTPQVFGTPPPRTVTDPEGFGVDTYFPAQRLIEHGAYRGKRSGARQGQNCAEALQSGTPDPLGAADCQGYLSVSFAALEKPVLSSVTVLRFANDGAAAKAAQALKSAPGAIAFILPDGLPAPAPTPGAKPAAGTSPRIETVGHYVTVVSSRPVAAQSPTPQPPAGQPSAPQPGTGQPPAAGLPATAPAATTPVPVPASPTPGQEQVLDEATRALSYSAGAPFIWS